MMTEGPHKLPKGWRWVRLGEVCLKTERRNPSQDPDNTFVYVDISSIDNDLGKIISPKLLKGIEAPSRARKVIHANDIIFATTRPYLKNIALVPSELDNQICSTGFCVIRANLEVVEPEYLYHLCRSDHIIEQLNINKMRGASYPAVTDNDVFETYIPLPPLPDQRRIVARIEELMERVREAKRLRAEAKKDADLLMQSALAEAFPRPGSPLPQGWRWVRLGEVTSLIRSGFAFRKKGASGGDLLHLRPYNIGTDGTLDLSQQFLIPSDVISGNEIFLEPGDVLFNNTNSVELVGKTALVTERMRSVFSNHITLIRTHAEICEGGWLAVALRSLWQQGFFAQRCNKWIGQAGYNTKMLEETLIPLPPLPEQRRIVAYLDQIQAHVTALKQAQQETESELRKLEQAILGRAFKGKL